MREKEKEDKGECKKEEREREGRERECKKDEREREGR
jgi:hypothetical protein